MRNLVQTFLCFQKREKTHLCIQGVPLEQDQAAMKRRASAGIMSQGTEGPPSLEWYFGPLSLQA